MVVFGRHIRRLCSPLGGQCDCIEDGTHHGLTYLTRLLGFVISTQWNVLISSNRLIVS